MALRPPAITNGPRIEFFAILPKKPKGAKGSWDLTRDILRNAMARVGRTGVKMLAAVTATWSAPPVKWYVSRVIKAAEPGVYIHTADPRYLWVDRGTAPHKITPRAGGKLETKMAPRRKIRVVKGQQVEMDYANREAPQAYLHYQRDYTAKTTPGVLGSQRGGKSGSWVLAREVTQHIKARHFSEMVADELQAELERVAVDVSKQLAVLLSAANVPSEKVPFGAAARRAKLPAAPPAGQPVDLAGAVAKAANITEGEAPAITEAQRNAVEAWSSRQGRR